MLVRTLRAHPWPPVAQRPDKGFTAIELMVVVAIVAILSALAAPSFRDLMDGWRVRSALEEITNTIYYARSEAIKRGGRVSVRKNCGTGTNQEWQCGWIVFTDANSNGALNTAAPDLDVVLQTIPMQRGTNVNNLSGAAFFTLDRWGQINALGAASFSVTPDPLGASSRHASALCVTSGGRIKSTKGTVTC
jgi:type IV fimbrial biogenesis protein FimT